MHRNIPGMARGTEASPAYQPVNSRFSRVFFPRVGQKEKGTKTVVGEQKRKPKVAFIDERLRRRQTETLCPPAGLKIYADRPFLLLSFQSKDILMASR